MFELLKTTKLGRRGTIETTHGKIDTPFFMPVGTAGAMKGITHDDLIDLGAQILLCNTYHLHIQPGEDTVSDACGLHSFIGWNKPILTDSGGYQVYSLRRNNKIKDEGVNFNSHLDGAPLFMGPKESITIQYKLGADIIMCFDECPPSTASKPEIEKAVDRTLRWAAECKQIHNNLKNQKKQRMQRNISSDSSDSSDSSACPDRSRRASSLFGIVQGGLDLELRKKCAEELIAMDFDGYAIGGLAVGEEEEDMLRVVEAVTPILPEDKPRYLMGVGVVSQMKKCIAHGIDMFDCVLPMRIARHGTLLMSDGSELRITNAKFKNDHSPIDSYSPSKFSRTLHKSYLHHLIKAGERLGETYAQMQNIGVTLKEMSKIRDSI